MWSAFPTRSRVKLWIDQDDRLMNALHLYHPYSLIGRVVTEIIRRCPDGWSRRLFTSSHDAGMREELNELRDCIRETLDCPQAAISFSAGTNGPHRKLTAQVTHTNRVVAYVKIGTNEAVSSLLAQEGRMLQWLHKMPIRSALIPTVLATHFREDRTLLFLSAPSSTGTRRPLELSESDLAFLEELSAVNHATCSVDQYWDGVGLDAFLQQVTASDTPAADLLHETAAKIATVFGNTKIRLSVAHGDYAPWNTMLLPEGRLYVIDWEYGRQHAPLCHDLFHRLLMPARLVEKASPRAAVEKLLNLHQHRAVAPFLEAMNIDPHQIVGYLALYFLSVAMHEHVTGLGPSRFILECLGRTAATVRHPNHRRQVLVSAYACDPDEGSEPGVGWHMCQTIAKVDEAWVITRSNNRQSIEAALAESPNPHLHFVYTDLPRWISFWKRKQRGVRLYYYLWQWSAWWTVRRLGQRISFDVAHHVTFVNDWLFTFLALMPYPYVSGPIGSHPKAPRALTTSWIAFAVDRLRYYFQAAIRTLDPLFWLSAARASLIVGIEPTVGSRFPLSLFTDGKFVTNPAIAVEPVLHSSRVRASAKDSFRVLSMGRLVPIKAFHLVIEAFALFSRTHPTATLMLVGRGPEQPRLERLARTLGVLDQVRFIDWLPRSMAFEEMRKANLFLFPSFEGGGMVVLEALAHGLPVVCLQYGGPGEMVSTTCGLAVPVGRREETVQALAMALQELADNPRKRAAMGSAARQDIAERRLWSARGQVVRQWYDMCAPGARCYEHTRPITQRTWRSPWRAA